MVLKSMGKIGTRRGRSIVVRDDIDKTVSGRRVRQGIGTRTNGEATSISGGTS